MGFLDSFSAVVSLKYKADTEEAKAAIRGLSGEQKKAAKEEAERVDQAGKNYESLAAKYAKGAAVVVAGYVVLKASLDEWTKRQTLQAAASKISVDALSESAGGLKTRMELLSIAAAGSNGAWKLTTGQLQTVVEGMRALEKKGYDATEITNQLTESLKKGKIEGLDKFGLSIKSTGNQAQDLNLLLGALRGEVRGLGGDLSKAGDDAKRAGTKLENAFNLVKSGLGREVEGTLDKAQRAGRILGSLANRDRGWGDAWDAGRGVDDTLDERGISRADLVAQSIHRQNKARRDVDAANALAAREANQERGLAMLQAARDRKVDLANEDAAAKEIIDAYDASVTLRKQQAKDAKAFARSRDESNAIIASLGLGPPSVRSDGESRAYSEMLAGEARAEQLAARMKAGETRGGLDAGSAEREKWEIAKAGAASVKAARDADIAESAASDKSFLGLMFGPIEEFDAYAVAMEKLGGITESVAGQMYDAWASGSELTTKMVRKMIGAEIAAEGKKLLVRGISTTLSSVWPLNPAGLAAGAAMIAGAGAIGLIAREISGSSDSSSSSTPSRGATGSSGATSSHVMGGGSGDRIVVMGDGWADETPRRRAANFRAIQSRASGYRAAEGIRHG